MSKIYEVVDLSDYVASPVWWRDKNAYKLSWFQILTYRTKRFVIYGHGQWVGHIMDWAGCNFMHGRLPKSPVFDTVEEVVKWLRFQMIHEVYTEGLRCSGHHAGEYQCSRGCGNREVVSCLYLATFLKGGFVKWMDPVTFEDKSVRVTAIKKSETVV